MNVFNLLRFWPLLDNFDFFIGHYQTEVCQDISEELNRISVPFTFVCFGIATMFPKASEQFADMFLVLFEIVGIDKDVIKIDHDAFV